MRSHPRLTELDRPLRPDRAVASALRALASSARDLLAGLAVWAVLVPQAVAYAALAGAPPEAGLFAALAAGVAYAVFGTCRQLDVGPSSTIAITAAAALATVMAKFPARGLHDASRRARRADGRRARRSRSCCGSGSSPSSSPGRCSSASSAASALVIIVGQIPKLLGLTVETGNVPETLWRTIGALDEIGWETPAVGCAALAALLVLRRVAPRVPWALLVTAVSVALSRAFDLAAHGVAVIADVPAGLPTPAIPGVGLGEIGALSSGAARPRARRARRVDRRGSLARRPARLRDRPEPGARSRSAPRTSAPGCSRASRSTRASRAAPSGPERA